MDQSLEKAGALDAEHVIVLNDALRSTSEETALQVGLRSCDASRLSQRETPQEEDLDDDIDSAPPLFTRQASGNVVTLQYRAPEVGTCRSPVMRAV
jgi:hypothetical protein